MAKVTLQHQCLTGVHTHGSSQVPSPTTDGQWSLLKFFADLPMGDTHPNCISWAYTRVFPKLKPETSEWLKETFPWRNLMFPSALDTGAQQKPSSSLNPTHIPWWSSSFSWWAVSQSPKDRPVKLGQTTFPITGYFCPEEQPQRICPNIEPMFSQSVSPRKSSAG